MIKRLGHLRRKARAFENAALHELMGVFGSWLDAAKAFEKPKRNRLFPPLRTFWLFLAQALSADRSCREAVHKLLAWLACAQQNEASPNTAAYCKARKRLSIRAVKALHDDVVTRLQRSPLAQRRWCGRCVRVVDGSGISMPDTVENQQRYPQSKAVKPGCGFPDMRIVAMFSLATGALLRYANACRRVSERILFHRLWDQLEPGDVVLADKGFCGFADFYFLHQRGVDSVMALHQRRSVGLRKLKRLGPGDILVQWDKMKSPPTWLTKQQWAAVPDTLTVRHITFTVDIPGFRSRRFTIATTLLDPRQFPTRAFPELYRQRWRAELYLRDIKIAIGIDILRCKTPDMVEKELAVHVIAYNLIRATMLQAAHYAKRDPERISFKGTMQTLRQWAPIMALAPDEYSDWLRGAMLNAIARAPVPNRPNRVEPRARKRRPKNYQLLNKPRRQFSEIQHRNRYARPLDP